MGEHVRLKDGEDAALIDAAIARVQTWPEWHSPRPEPLEGVAVDRKAEHEAAERQVAGAA